MCRPVIDPCAVIMGSPLEDAHSVGCRFPGGGGMSYRMATVRAAALPCCDRVIPARSTITSEDR